MDLSDIEKLEAPAKVLKLSEAIRIGAKLRPQSFGSFFDGEATCAIGAAFEARSGYPSRDPNKIVVVVPEALSLYRGIHVGLSDIGLKIVQRNDYLDATREEIADWLEAQGY